MTVISCVSTCYHARGLALFLAAMFVVHFDATHTDGSSGIMSVAIMSEPFTIQGKA